MQKLNNHKNPLIKSGTGIRSSRSFWQRIKSASRVVAGALVISVFPSCLFDTTGLPPGNMNPDTERKDGTSEDNVVTLLDDTREQGRKYDMDMRTPDASRDSADAKKDTHDAGSYADLLKLTDSSKTNFDMQITKSDMQITKTDTDIKPDLTQKPDLKPTPDTIKPKPDTFKPDSLKPDQQIPDKGMPPDKTPAPDLKPTPDKQMLDKVLLLPDTKCVPTCNNGSSAHENWTVGQMKGIGGVDVTLNGANGSPLTASVTVTEGICKNSSGPLVIMSGKSGQYDFIPNKYYVTVKVTGGVANSYAKLEVNVYCK
jgi:hypothetical protein